MLMPSTLAFGSQQHIMLRFEHILQWLIGLFVVIHSNSDHHLQFVCPLELLPFHVSVTSKISLSKTNLNVNNVGCCCDLSVKLRWYRNPLTLGFYFLKKKKKSSHTYFFCTWNPDFNIFSFDISIYWVFVYVTPFQSPGKEERQNNDYLFD